MATMNTQTSTADFSGQLPTWWAESLFHDAIHQEFWAMFEGPERSQMPIISKTDLTVKPGTTMRFTSKSRILNDGVTGHSTLEASEGEFTTTTWDLAIDWLRNGLSTDKKTDKEVFFNWTMEAKAELAEWLARRKDYNFFNQLISTASPTVLYANGKTADTALDSNSVFGTAEIDLLKLALTRKGVKPMKILVDNKQIFPKYGCVITEMDEYYLRGDDVWERAQRYARPRSAANPIFDGSIGEWNGMLVFVHRGVAGLLGTPLRPETSLTSSLAAGGGTATVTARNAADMTRYFPSSGTLKITRASDGLFEYATYSSKTDSTFVLSARGNDYASDGTGTTALAFTAADGSDKITLQNSRSIQIGFGAEMGLRGWGLQPRGTTNVRDYGFEFGVGVECVFGQKEILDSNSSPSGYVTLHSNSSTPNASV